MKKQTANVLFRAICLLFSAVLAVLSLLCGIDQTAANDRATNLEREIQTLEKDNQILLARCENKMDLEELERLATEELGMQKPDPSQIVTLELTE